MGHGIFTALSMFHICVLGIPMHVLNSDYFGQVMIPLDWHHNIHLEEEQFLYMRNEALGIIVFTA